MRKGKQIEMDSGKGLLRADGKRKFESITAYIDRCSRNKITKKNTDPKKKLGWNLKRYGITVEQYDSMLAEQNGRCPLCGDKPKRLFVDHCHKTNEVRGLLCSNCNTVLGMVKENPRTLKMMILFLNWWSGKRPEEAW